MKYRGFTLIELLAVIVILAIIALIAIPMISKIIDKTEDSAVLRSAELYIDGVNQAIMRANLTNKIRPKECIIQTDGNLICDGEYEIKIDATGTKPSAGTLIIEDRAVKTFTNMILDIYELEMNEKGKIIIIKKLGELDISSLTYDIDKTNVASIKVVTITYPIIKDKKPLYEYSIDNGLTWNAATQIQKIEFRKNGSVIARVTIDGYTKTAYKFVVNNIIEPQGSYLKTGSTEETFLDGTISRATVETITVTNTKQVPSTAIGSWDVSEAQDKSVMAWYLDEDDNSLYELYIGGEGGVKANPNSSRLFYKFENVTSIDLKYLDTSEVTNMSYMFKACNSLTKLGINNFNTENVTTMQEMFDGCQSIESLDISNFKTDKVTTMYAMFWRAESLKTIDLSNFNTSNVTNMAQIFMHCKSLTEIDISNFDTSNVTTMQYMFEYCSNLVTIDMRNAIFTKVSEYPDMFRDCSKLTGIYVKDSTAKTFITSRLSESSKTGVTITIA